MAGQFIDDAGPQFIDDAGPSASSFNAGNDVGANRAPVAKSFMDKLKQGLMDRAKSFSNGTPAIASPGALYRLVTGSQTSPTYLPDPTTQGMAKGVVNMAVAPVRQAVYLGSIIPGYLKSQGITSLPADIMQKVDTAVNTPARAMREENTGFMPSATGEMIPQAALLMAGGPLKLGTGLASRLGSNALEGALANMVMNPQSQAQTPEAYRAAQGESGLIGGALGLGGGLIHEVASPLVSLSKGGLPKTGDVRTLAPELKAAAGENQGLAARSDLANQYAADRAQYSAPFQELRASDFKEPKSPNVTIHDSTSYQGVRQNSLLGPNDEMMVARDKNGKDVGKLWIEKDPEGFIVHKIEVDPSARRQGIASELYDQAEAKFGPRLGATDQTPEGKAFVDARKAAQAAPTGESVPLAQYKKALQDQIKEVQQSGSRVDPKTVNILQGYLDAIDQNPEKGWNRALNISSGLNGDINAAMHGLEPNRQLARHLEIAKTALKNDLNAEGVKYGDKYTQAMKGWEENVSPWEDPGKGGSILYHAMNNPVPDKMINQLINKTPDEAAIYYNRMSDAGKSAVKSHILESIMEEAKDANGHIDPFKFNNALNKRKGSISVFFNGDDATRLEGLSKIMKAASAAGSVTASGAGAALAASFPGLSRLSMPFAAAAGQRLISRPLARGFAEAFQTPAGQRLLLDAGGLAENSPQLADLASKFPGVAGNSGDKLKDLLGVNK